MKKRAEFVLIALVLAFVVPLAGASVAFKQPNAIYNVGDELNSKVDVSSLEDLSDSLIVDLICNGNSNEIVKLPMKISAGGQKSQEIVADLNKEILGGLSGQCFLKGSYGSDSAETGSFEISNVINLNMDNLTELRNPGESIFVSGRAIKQNGKLAEGIASLNVDGLNVYQTTSISGGVIGFNFSIPDNAKSTDYAAQVVVYDKDKNGEIMNSGNSNFSFKVKSVLTNLDIALSESKISPGNSFVYTIFALDQAGDNMPAQVNTRIVSPIGTGEDSLVQTSQSYQINTKLNTTFGQWKIIVSSGNISFEKTFDVLEHMSADFSLLGNVLTLINTGNVPYNKQIQVNIGGESIVMNSTSISVGSSKTFELEAPDGEYDISASDGASSKSLGKTFLSGNVVAVNDPNSRGFVNLTTWIWILAILVLGILAFVYYNRVAKKNYYGATPRHVNILSGKTTRADSIQYGNKENASIVALKLKGHESGSEHVKGMIQDVLSDGRRAGAYIEQGVAGTFLFIFTKAITKQEENTLSAVEFGKKIAEKINALGVKVGYGIGVNNGELIVENRGGTLRYNSIGSTIFAARKMADSAENAMLISDSVHSITRARVKVERAMHGWKVSNIKDTGKYSDFINKFMTRQKTGRDLV